MGRSTRAGGSPRGSQAQAHGGVTAQESLAFANTSEGGAAEAIMVQPHEQPLAVGIASTATTPTSVAAGGSVPPRFPPFRESYSDMSELRRELKVLSVRTGAPYYMQHSSPQRLEARCPTWKQRKQVPASCEFVISANRHTNGRVYVTRAVLQHAENCPVLQSDSTSISAAALMETAKPFMTALKKESVKPKDMAEIMKQQFGVSTSYMTAWRALSAFRQQKKDEERASFTKINGYLNAFAEGNAGSVVAFEHAEKTTVFARAFLCPKPLQTALRYCRSAVLLSVFLATSTYGGVVMTATAQDAMGENLPLAIAIAPSESEGHWAFFLQHLHAAIPDFDRFVTTIVHNRGEDLQRALQTEFPTCVQSDSVDLFVSPPSLVPPSSPSASSASSASTSGVDSSFQWLEGLCSKAPLMILVGWVSKIASTLFQRYDKYGQISSDYPEEFHALLLQYEAEAHHYDVLRVAENAFEVVDQHTGRQRIVDFAKQTCTCGEYDVSRFPCLHVFLAISVAGLLRADVIPRIFLMTSLKALYGGRVTPIDVETVPSDHVTTPNPVPKTRGRPRKVQQIQQFGDAKQEKLSCSICGVKGHNKRTCKRVLSHTASGSGAGISSAGVHAHLSSSMSHHVDLDNAEPNFLDASYEEDISDITGLSNSSMDTGNAVNGHDDDKATLFTDSGASPSTKRLRTNGGQSIATGVSTQKDDKSEASTETTIV